MKENARLKQDAPAKEKKLFQDFLPYRRKTEILCNLKHNWFFPFSALAYFCMNAKLTFDFLLGIPIAFLAFFFLASQIPSVWQYTKSHSILLRTASLLSSLGVCLGSQAVFYANWNISSKTQALEKLFPAFFDLPIVLSVVGVLASWFFTYFCMLVFLKQLSKIFHELETFQNIRRAEWIFYGILIVLSIAFMTISFLQTDAFYGTEFRHDIIYTSDSPSLVKENAYFSLAHSENDLRQPLFAVFSAPFIGLPYLISRLLGGTNCIQAIFMNSIQIVMLFVANLMLAKTINLNPLKRSCFMLLASCTYMYLLFSLMMEQYIVAFFWVSLCVSVLAKKRTLNRLAFWGAGGTLLTGIAFLPFVSKQSPFESFREWLKNTFKHAIEFAVLLLFFSRFDIFLNAAKEVVSYVNFSGKEIGLLQKFSQYTLFVRNCFLAPRAGANTTAVDHISWQLDPSELIHWSGILIFVLAILSAVWNRKKKSSLIAAGWIGFSVLMLFVLGWGTQENGLILYSLYFGWAFFLLLFQLVEKIESVLKIKFLVPLFALFAASAMLVINIPSIIELICFAITNFPI